jgi:hypothetical protein
MSETDSEGCQEPQQRALRRHHRQRMIARARRVFERWFEDPEEAEMRARHYHSRMASCSCWMCGNPRKYSGSIPIQEQRRHRTADADATACRQEGASPVDEG